MQQKRRTLRRWAQKSHTWVGLIAGLLFCLMGISGAVLAFRPHIETAFTPKLSNRPGCAGFDADNAVAALNIFTHGQPVDRIIFPIASGRPIVFQLKEAHPARIAYDPCSNRVLGIVNLAWLDWLADLHHNLLAGKTGRSVVGAIGIAVLFSSLSGMFVWFTSNRKLWPKIQWSASPRRIVYDLHRSVGILAFLVLLVQACTGIGLAYPQLLHSVLDGKSGSKPQKRKTSEKKNGRSSGPLSVTRAIRLAQEAIPDGTIRELRGLADGRQIQVRFWRHGDTRSSGSNFIYLNAAGTKVTAVQMAADRTKSSRLTELFTAIHYGEWGGIGSRILLTLAGTALVLLFVSGFLIRWWPMRRKRNNPANQKQNNELATV